MARHRFSKRMFICAICSMVLYYGCRTLDVRENQVTTGFTLGAKNVNYLNDISINVIYVCENELEHPWYCSNFIVFYDDGSFSFLIFNDSCVTLHPKSEKYMTWNLISGNTNDSIDLLTHLYAVGKVNHSKFIPGGAYKIDHSEIITEHPCEFTDHPDYSVSNFYGTWILARHYFKIVDKRTIVLERQELVSKNKVYTFDMNAKFHFRPAKNIPEPSLMYAKSFKWMWRDKKEWKEAKKIRKAEWKKSIYYVDSPYHSISGVY